jgi:ABC-type molybdate transport system substrate-binding protein
VFHSVSSTYSVLLKVWEFDATERPKLKLLHVEYISERLKNIFVSGRIAIIPASLLSLGLLLISSLYLSFGQQNRMVDAQQAITSGKGGEEVDVLYSGSLISVMETKMGPAFSHLGFVYRGEGHGSIQDANMIIDGQRSPDVFISVDTEPVTKLINNNPSLAKWYIGFASDELVIAYNPKSHFASEFEKVKAGSMPWYQVLSTPGTKFLRSDPLLD